MAELISELLPFQRTFIREAFRKNVLIAALSLARGNGKSAILSYILARYLDPKDPFFQPGKELILLAGSFSQARFTFKPLRDHLEASGEHYFISENDRKMEITHVPTRTKLITISSSAKQSFGMGANTALIVGDECGSWEVNRGSMMWDSIKTSIGKPDSNMRVILASTRSPATNGWWIDLLDGGSDPEAGIYVMQRQANPKKWDKASELKKCNPLMWKHKQSRQVLLAERDKARNDPALKSQFMSYRCNIASADESVMICSMSDWHDVLKRPVQPRRGSPVLGIDLSGSRSWSACCALWNTGRVEAIAQCPGIPDIRTQEARDRQKGVYSKLLETGHLQMQSGKRIPEIRTFLAYALNKFGHPHVIICDRFRIGELSDALEELGAAVEIKARSLMPSETSDDIRRTRKFLLDSALNIEKNSRALLTHSVSVARVHIAPGGVERLKKPGTNNTARDDVIFSLVLAAGQASRMLDEYRLESSVGIKQAVAVA